jgi:hypothetical protein
VDNKRLYAVVGASAVMVHIGALWNRFALDDLYIIAWNPLVHSLSGVWRAFGAPYWPPDFGGRMYRPLPLATYALDWQIGSFAWFHAVNLLWHAGVAVVVAMLARRWAGTTAALAAGLIFAVHPVHVEAVANVVGRAELMAAVCVCLAVYAALVKQSVGWSAIALAAGLVCKENAAVAPALIVWAWLVGIDRPSRPRILAFMASWVVVAAAYIVVRETVLHPYTRFHDLAPVFAGHGPFAIRLTAVAAFADVGRLLVFPLTLRADYSPAEREIVTSILDWRFLLGLACLVLWAVLLAWAWMRGRRVEVLGLGWIAITILPVANLIFPTGILVAERTLYLPSIGLALAAGTALARVPLPPRQFRAALLLMVLMGAARTAWRVPVWRDDTSVTLSILEDSPRSYRGPARTGVLLQNARQPARALDAFTQAARIYDRDPAILVAAADAAFAVGRPQLADSLLMLARRDCPVCLGYLRLQAAAALSRGDSAVADSLLGRSR